MEKIAEKLTCWFFSKGIIQEDQIQWCHYMIVHRTMNLVSLIWLVPVGSLVSEWYTSLAFVLSYRLLRSRTGGYHARTSLGCLCIATSLQLSILSVIPYIASPIYLIPALVVCSLVIVFFSPENSNSIHLSPAEIKALVPQIKARLLMLWILVFGFSWVLPDIAKSLALGVIATGVLLIIPKTRIGVK